MGKHLRVERIPKLSELVEEPADMMLVRLVWSDSDEQFEAWHLSTPMCVAPGELSEWGSLEAVEIMEVCHG